MVGDLELNFGVAILLVLSLFLRCLMMFLSDEMVKYLGRPEVVQLLPAAGSSWWCKYPWQGLKRLSLRLETRTAFLRMDIAKL